MLLYNQNTVSLFFVFVFVCFFLSKTNSLKPYKCNRINTTECHGIPLFTDCYMYSPLALHILAVNCSSAKLLVQLKTPILLCKDKLSARRDVCKNVLVHTHSWAISH